MKHTLAASVKTPGVPRQALIVGLGEQRNEK